MTPLIKKIEAAIKKIDNLDRLYADIAFSLHKLNL